MKKILLIFISAVFILGCSRKKEEAPKLDSFPVNTETVSKKNLENILVIVGSLKAKDEATLYSRVPGKLLENLVKEGDQIKKGQAVSLVERDEVGVKFEPAPVPSTLDGVVGRIYLDRGTNVTMNSPVALVVDNSEILVQGDVPESNASKVYSGQGIRVKVESYPNEIFYGKITKVSPVVDSQTRSSAIEAKIDVKSGHLKSGMFAELSIIIQKKNDVLAIPLEAVVEEGGENFVFVFQNNKAVKRKVKLGLRSKKDVEILQGVSKNEDVITFGLYGLKDGSPVEKIKG